MKLIFLVVFTGLIISISSFAQSPESKESFGRLSGQILGKNKVGVPKVKLIIEGKNFSREIESNNNGYYEVWLAKGRYMVKITGEGVVHKQVSVMPKKPIIKNFLLKNTIVPQIICNKSDPF